MLITGRNEVEQKAIEKARLAEVFYCPPVKVPHKNPLLFIILMWRMLVIYFKTIHTCIFYKPSKVVSTGGILSIPVFAAAKTTNVPTELWSLDAVPGKAVSILERLTDHHYICFPSAQRHLKKAAEIRGYPVRFKSQDVINKNVALEQIGFSKKYPTLCILGGSQGSHELNELLKNYTATHYQYAEKIQIIHQSGSADQESLIDHYKKKGIKAIVFSYTQEIPLYLSAADVIICRSGAGTLAEALFFNKQIITIPLKTDSTSHQYDNAKALSDLYPRQVQVMSDESISPKNLDAALVQARANVQKND
jgi:UDP-N-acetylglucosamine--N-acetylmuramyl-(pentapeptide) pyrophosphoryl-undecaprenol N-acetylglucosamine transferase